MFTYIYNTYMKEVSNTLCKPEHTVTHIIYVLMEKKKNVFLFFCGCVVIILYTNTINIIIYVILIIGRKGKYSKQYYRTAPL